MSKAVMLSIKPKYCELIARGKKTIEVRKTTPKIDTPFKCYIYATKPKTYSHPARIYNSFIMPTSGKCGSGRVIGVFVCDRIDKIKNQGSRFMICDNIALTNSIAESSCLDYDDMRAYLGNKDGYGWHISDLVIYDTPKELGEFQPYCNPNTCVDCKCFHSGACADTTYCGRKPLTRPPQSWCYVEEI